MFSLKQIIEQPQLIENISNEQLNDWLKAYPYVSFLHLEKYKRNRTDEQKNKTAFYITHRDVIFKIDYSKQNQESKSIEDTSKEIIPSAIQIKQSEISADIAKEQTLITEQTPEVESEIITEALEVGTSNQEPEQLSIADQILAELKHRKEEDSQAAQTLEIPEIVETEQTEAIEETPEVESEIITEALEVGTSNQEPEQLSIADQILAELKHRKAEESSETKIVELPEIVEKEQAETIVKTLEVKSENITETLEVESPNQETEQLSIADQILAELKHRKEEESSETKIVELPEIKETEQAETIEETPEVKSENITETLEVESPNQEPEQLSIADQILAELKHRKEAESLEAKIVELPEIIETEQTETIVKTSEVKSENITETLEVETSNQELEQLSIADQILAELKHRKEEESLVAQTVELPEIIETEQTETIEETPEVKSENINEVVDVVEQENRPISLVDQILIELKNRKETVSIQIPENESQAILELKSEAEKLEDIEKSSDEQIIESATTPTSKIDTPLEAEIQSIEQPKVTAKPFSIADQILSAIQQITSKVITIPMEKAIAQIKETEPSKPIEATIKSSEINVNIESIESLPIIKITNDFIFDEVQMEGFNSTQESLDNLEQSEEDDTYFPSIPIDELKVSPETNNDIKIEKIKSQNESNLQAIKIDSFIPKSNKTIDEKHSPDIVLKEVGDFRQSSEPIKINIDEIHPIERNRHKIIEIAQKDETHTFLEWLNIVDKSYEQNTQKLDTTRKHYNYENQFILENKTELQQSILEGELDSETEIDEDVNKMAEESISFKQEMATEILAKILVKQEHFEKAIEVYQKLILKYPEKSSTFVAQIEFLKKQIQ